MNLRSCCRIVLGLCFLCAAQMTVAEDHGVNMVADDQEAGDALPRDSGSQLRERIARHLPMSNQSKPEWFLNVSRQDFDVQALLTDGSLQLVLQKERCDGAELLTLRYPVAIAGRLRTYAGVGLNRAVYFSAAETGPTVFNRRNRHRSLGGAAEFGIEVPLSKRVYLNADLRWIDIDRDAVMLRTEQGLVAADAVSAGCVTALAISLTVELASTCVGSRTSGRQKLRRPAGK